MQEATLINLPKNLDKRGNLSFIESNNQIPFRIQRTYWIYDVPGGESRGGHAFIENEELIIALSGSFEIVIDDGRAIKTYNMNRSYYGLYIPTMNWREIINFSTNSLALILSSTSYNEKDYIRNYDRFKELIYEDKCI